MVIARGDYVLAIRRKLGICNSIRMPLEYGQQTAVSRIPHSCHMIITCRDKAPAVWSELRTPGQGCVSNNSKEAAIRRIPYSCRIVMAWRDNAPAVGRELCHIDLVGVSLKDY